MSALRGVGLVRRPLSAIIEFATHHLRAKARIGCASLRSRSVAGYSIRNRCFVVRDREDMTSEVPQIETINGSGAEDPRSAGLNTAAGVSERFWAVELDHRQLIVIPQRKSL